MTRLSVMVGLALALGTAAGCTRFGGKQNGNTNGPEAGVPVVVVAAEQGTMAQTVTVTGTIRAGREADIGAQIAARVLEVKVREGDSVSAGQVLVTLDAAQAQSQVRQARAGAAAAAARLAAAKQRLDVLEAGARQEEKAISRSRLEQAESALKTAAADLERLRGLHEEGAISKQQLDGAQTAYDTARTNRDSARQALELMEKGARPEEIEAGRKDVEAAAAGLDQAKGMLTEAEERLSYTVIRSPLTGVVYERHVEPGEITSTGGGDPLLRLADLSTVYYEATVPERVALRVKPGQRVDVVVQGNGDRSVEGKVDRLVPVANPSSRDFLVRMDIVEGAEVTKPGMFARGSVVVQESAEAVVVPKDALVERGGKLLAFVVAAGKAEQREVKVGISDAERAEIVSGIAPGEQVVVIGAQGLQNGDPVQVKENGGQ
jgi:HlyD family secretion protein